MNAADVVVLTRAVMGQVSLPSIIIGPDAPTLNSIAASTTSNPYTVTGTAALNVDVRLYINGQYQSVIKSSAVDGSFSFKAALYDGANSITAKVWDGSSESAPSNTLNIQYNNNIARSISATTINTDTVWTPAGPGGANDPYLITGNLTVAIGTKFTLQAGTVLKFSSGGTFLVNGNLQVPRYEHKPGDVYLVAVESIEL